MLGALEGRYEIAGFTPAWDPAFPPLEAPDANILMCPFYPPPNPLPGMQLRHCADCDGVVCVSPSSLWLLA